ncbi:hypothetical protein ACJQWK_01821 [Exserohilum turcicum]
MSVPSEFSRFAAQMHSFRQSDEAREHFVSEILGKYQALTEEHTNLHNDYLSERDNRRNYQRLAEERQAQVVEFER